MLRPALIVSAFAAIGMVVNFLLQMSLAYVFGAQDEIDAYVAAITLPTLVNSVVLASLNYAFIPALVECRMRGEPNSAWHLASNMLNLCCVVLASVAVIGVVFAHPLLELTVPGFPDGKLGLAVGLAQIMWPTAILTGASTLLAGIYQSQGQFGRPALAPVLSAVVMLGGVWLLSPRFGIYAVVLSALLGGLAQIVLLVPILLRTDRYRPRIDLGSAHLRGALWLALPLIVGGLFSRAAPVLDRFVASALPTGSIAHLDYAAKVVASLLAISLAGLSATILPALAETASQTSQTQLRATISQGLRTVWALLIPIAVIGTVLRTSIITVLFQRGSFTAADTSEVAAVLPWFLIAMLGMGIGGVIGPAFYAMKDTLTPATLGVAEIVVYAAYLPAAAHLFGVVGMALAGAVYWNTGLVVFIIVLWRRLGHGGATIARSVVRSSFAAACGGGAATVVCVAVGWEALPSVALGGPAGILTHALIMHLLGAQELRPAIRLVVGIFSGWSRARTGAHTR